MVTMHLKDEQKIEILLIQLQERYDAAHKMRERSTQFSIWLSGMAIGLAWLLINQGTLALPQRLSLTLLIATFWIGAGFFIMGMRKGFQRNRRTMIKVEQALGMYDDDAYIQNDSLLPESYSQTNKKWNDHFSTLCVWLCIVALSLIVLTWSCPERAEQNNPNIIKIGKIIGGKKHG
jgi:hypothetical protein